MRQGWRGFALRGGLLASLLVAGCDCGESEPIGEAWLTDEVFAPRPDRDESRPLPDPSEPSEPSTRAPSTTGPEPGSIEVSLGEPAEGPPLDEVPRARSVNSIGRAEYAHLRGRRGPLPRAPGLHVVLDAPYQSWAGEGTFVHALVMDDRLRPVPGAEVYLGPELVARTDEHGAVAFRRTPTEEQDGSSGVLTFKHGDQLRTIAYRAGTRTESFEGKTVYVYSDRGVYQPGQTMHVRAIGWKLRGEYTPLENQRIELQLLDDDRRVVHGGVIETGELGTGTFDVPLPEHIEEGRYQLAALIGGERAEADVRIERFVTPVISIEHDLPRFVTPDVPSLEYELTLGYLSGGSFGEAEVAVRLEVDGDTVETLPTREVQGPGPHAMTIPEDALDAAREASRVGGRIDVVLEVTDPSGRQDEVRRMLRYERVPYRVVIELDRTQYASGDPVQANVRVVDLDAVPVREKQVRLSVKGRQLRAATDDSGIAAFHFAAPRGESSVPLEAFLDDVRERVASARLSIREPLPMRSAVPETVVQEETDLAVEIAFPTSTVPVERVVHADLVDSSGAIIRSALVPVEGGVARGTIRTPSWGSVLLTLWAVGRRGREVGLMTDGQNLTVTPDRELQVTLQGLPERAAPGDEVDVAFRVTGPDGEPRRAVASAAVVDRGVISMLDPLERAPVDRFYNPERKVLASTGSQTLTWPVVQRTWGPDRYDIGWPARFGWHAGAPSPRPVPPEVLERLLRPGPADRTGGMLGVLDGMTGAYNSPTSPFGSDSALGNDPMSALGSLMGEEVGESAGLGGLGLRGTGRGGGGLGQGTIGLGNLGTIGHGAPVAAPPVVEESAPVELVVRTDFAETSGWWPDIQVAEGVARFTAELPDSITEQEVAVVVSDGEGGVGVARGRVAVRQALHARSDLPATLVAGDRVSVAVAARNLTDTAHRVRLSLTSDDLEVRGDPLEIDIEPDGTGTARFTVKGERPGSAEYRVIAETLSVVADGQRLRDEEVRTLHVHPAGTSTRTVHTGVARDGDDYEHTFTLDPADRHHVVRLGVALPTVVPALEDVVTMASEGFYGIGPATSRTMAGAAAYEYLRRRGTDEVRQEQLRRFLGQVSASLVMAQNEDGGWGGWRGTTSELHTTAFALESLVALSRAGQHVPREVVARGARKLSSFVAEGTVDVSDVAPWEGDSEAVRQAMLAQSFHVLAQVARDRPGVVRPQVLEDLGRQLVSLFEIADTTPLVVARTGLGLMELANAEEAPEAFTDPRATANRAARLVADVGRLLSWEPGWFEAYGGRIEAAYAALLLLDQLDHDSWESARREALRFLLSTRGAWGAWHNARSAAFAIRALLLLEPAPAGDSGTVVVSLDGEEIRRVEVSATDLYATALALRSIELPAEPGEHTVEVRYDGGLRARVDLAIERWGAGASAAAAATPEGPRGLGLGRELPTEVAPGAALEASYAIRAGREVGAIHLRQPLSAALTVDREALEAARDEGRIVDFSLRPNEVVLILPPGTAQVTLPMWAMREGEVTLAPAKARSLAHSASVATSGPNELRIGR